MTRDPRRCISPLFGSPRGEIIVDSEGCITLYKSVFVNDPSSARLSTLRDAYPELLERCADDETALIYWPWFREFLVPILDGGPSAIVMDYDPFSGRKLPMSLRDKWFEAVEAKTGREVGLFDDAVPLEFQGEAWWIELKL